MSNTPKRDNAWRAPGKVGKSEISNPNRKPPLVTGQCAQVLTLIREHQPIISLTITADNAVPECAARVHDLRATGFNILTTIHPTVMFRGVERHNVASYSLGTPEWPRLGFFDVREG